MSQQIVNFRPSENSEWTRFAYCAVTGTDMFPNEKDQQALERARATCADCPVVAECLVAAETHHESYGVWGGLTADERRYGHQRAMRLANNRRKEEAAEMARELDSAVS